MSHQIFRDVIDSFSEAGFQEEALRLEHLLDLLGSEDASKSIKAAEDIISWCHPKAWGDLNIAGRAARYKGDIYKWKKKLNELEKAAKRELKKLREEKDSPIYKQVLDLLQKNGFLDYMEELQKYIEALHSSEKEQVIYASKRIQEMCHVRVLGDLSIEDMQGYDWWNMLLKLSRYAKKKEKKYSSGEKGE